MVILVLYAAPVRASAVSPEPLSQADQETILGFYNEYDVSPEIAQSVIRNLERGNLPDSDDGAAPVRVTARPEGDTVVRISSFADGSISVSEAPDLHAVAKAGGSGSVAPFSVSGCTYSSAGSYGGYWKNCVARHRTALLTLAFRFSYSSIKDEGSKVYDYCCAEHISVGGSFTEGKFVRLRQDVVRYEGTYTVYGGAGSFTRWMQVLANGTTAWTEMN